MQWEFKGVVGVNEKRKRFSVVYLDYRCFALGHVIFYACAFSSKDSELGQITVKNEILLLWCLFCF